MKFQFEQRTDDGGGALTFIAENAAEVSELARHFRMFDKDDPEQLMALAQAMQAGTLSHTSYSEKRPWFEVESALEYEFTQPYLDKLSQMTGYNDHIPDMDLTPFHPRRLCHTHITDRVWLEGGHICYRAFVKSEDWNGKTAGDRSFTTAEDYVQEDFGTRPQEPEYISASGRGGLMKHNPNYLKRHKAKPACTAEWFWRVLFSWWLDNHASEAQKAIYNANVALHEGNKWHARDNFGLKDYSINYLDPNGTTNWDGGKTKVGTMSHSDFAKL